MLRLRVEAEVVRRWLPERFALALLRPVRLRAVRARVDDDARELDDLRLTVAIF